jgi:hypothetical protein
MFRRMSDDAELAGRIARLTRASRWRPVAAIPLAFETHHPQGMVRVGERFFLSSVEIVEPTVRHKVPCDGFDRTPGRGRGILFEFDEAGNKLREASLGEGDIYHPGGIDFDGTHIWVPVAEYRPDSRAIVYRVDPETLTATEVLRHGDHLGAIVHAHDRGELHAASWGGRRYCGWKLDGAGKAGPAAGPHDNPSHYVDFQDCHYLGGGRMLCSGLAAYRMRADAPEFALGGIEIVELPHGRPVFQLPVPLWTASGRPMTQNPFWAETHADGVRFHFVPEDDRSTRYVYDVAP